MCSSDGILITKELFASPLFKGMSCEEKMYFLTAFVFANGCGAICNDVEDIALVAGVKNWKKVIKKLEKLDLIEVKDNMFYIVEDRLMFNPDSSTTRKTAQEITPNVISLIENKKQVLMNKFAGSNFKFDYWRDCFNREIDYLETHDAPLDWIMGILYKVYVTMQEKYKSNGGYQVYAPNYLFKVVRQITEDSIRNSYPPPYPERKNTDIEMELTKFNKIKAMIGGNINTTIGAGVGVLVCTAVNIIILICNAM